MSQILFRKTIVPGSESSDGDLPVTLICEKLPSERGYGFIAIYLEGPLGWVPLRFQRYTGSDTDAIETAVDLGRKPLLDLWPEEHFAQAAASSTRRGHSLTYRPTISGPGLADETVPSAH